MSVTGFQDRRWFVFEALAGFGRLQASVKELEFPSPGLMILGHPDVPKGDSLIGERVTDVPLLPVRPREQEHSVPVVARVMLGDVAPNYLGKVACIFDGSTFGVAAVFRCDEAVRIRSGVCLEHPRAAETIASGQR